MISSLLRGRLLLEAGSSIRSNTLSEIKYVFKKIKQSFQNGNFTNAYTIAIFDSLLRTKILIIIN